MDVVPYKIEKRNTIWSLYLVCPYCKQKVKHGGGDELEPYGGPRACNACSQPIRIHIRRNTVDTSQPLL